MTSPDQHHVTTVDPGHSRRHASAVQPNRGIVTYLILVFGIAWLPFAPALVGHDPVAIFLMPIAPLLAAVIIRRWVTREGFRDAGLRPNLRQWRFYLLAMSWPLVTIPASVTVGMALGLTPDGATVPWGVAPPAPIALIGWLLMSVLATPILFGEEFGWRGYLQVRLFQGRPWPAAVATGVIWGVWHYPLILTGGEATAHRVWTLVLFPVATTIASVSFGWLRLRTGDVWAPSLAHTTNNVTEDSWWRVAFTGQTSGVPTMSAAIPLVVVEALVLVGIVLIDSFRRRTLNVTRRIEPGPNIDRERLTSSFR